MKLYYCKGCSVSLGVSHYEYCVPCETTFKTKETPVIDDSNCHCGPCTAMNEPLTLEGDIRYLKAHIETKDRQLAEKDAAIANALNRGDIFRDAWADSEREVAKLMDKNAQLLTRITELEDTIMRLREEKRIGGLGHNLGLQQENERLREENKLLNTHKERYQQEILSLESVIAEYAGTVQRLRDILRIAHEQVETFVKG